MTRPTNDYFERRVPVHSRASCALSESFETLFFLKNANKNP